LYIKATPYSREAVYLSVLYYGLAENDKIPNPELKAPNSAADARDAERYIVQMTIL
jgi:hypothetical protein